MADVTTTAITGMGLEPILLLPNQIRTNPCYNARPFSSQNPIDEDALIEALALSIELNGQLDALILTPDHVLIAGDRRRKAVITINERRSARGQSLQKLRCVIDDTGGDYLRKAIVSNLHRKSSSPMDLAWLIRRLRQDNDWKKRGCTKLVADYLGIDEGTVYQHERFLAAEKELQNRVHSGNLSVQSALDLLKNVVTPADREAVIQRAGEIQAEERTEKALEDLSGKRTSLKQATAILSRVQSSRIERPAIIRAIRERHTITTTKKLCLSRSEIINSIAQFDTEDYPDSFRAFAHYWARTFVTGIGTAEELRQFASAIQPTSHTKNHTQSEAVAS